MVILIAAATLALLVTTLVFIGAMLLQNSAKILSALAGRAEPSASTAVKVRVVGAPVRMRRTRLASPVRRFAQPISLAA